MKIVVADDHPLILDGVVRALSQADDMEVIGTAASGPDAVALVKRSRPDVALLDIRMPGLDGLRCLELIRAALPDVKVVMLSSFADREHIAGALEGGAAAYVVKSVNPTDLPAAIRHVHEGTVFHQSLGAALADPQAEPAAGHGLTEREQTILRALARGLSNKAISKELWVTEQTVKFHLNNVYRKLGVDNRTAAVRYAFEHGLAESPDQPAAVA